MDSPASSAPSADQHCQASVSRGGLLTTLCTYNEAGNIREIIACIHEHAPDADVLVIDDNSPDGTGQIVDELAVSDPRVHVLHRAGKLGLGTATIAGFEFAIRQGYQHVLNLDADFSHHPRHIPALRAGMTEADVCIGSRYVPGGGVVGWGLKRHVMSRSINLYARLLLGLKTRDCSGSFRCYRVDQLAQLDFRRIRSRGYSFQEEVLYLCRRIGCRMIETPITFEDRRVGLSKINRHEVVMALIILLALGCDRLRRRRVTRSEDPHGT